MKKITFLLTLLLSLFLSTGAWADGLLPSTTESASAEYQYKIFCRNANTYYLGNTTNATNSGTDYGLFAFFADDSGDYTNGYYIYSIFEGKWVTYTPAASYSDGQNKISLVAEKPSVPWNIAADNSDNKYYDIRAFKTDKTVADVSWNWHGGPANNTSNTMGFYGYTDGNSGWGIVLAGGSGSTVADRKVVALYNVPSDNNQYALYNSSGTPKVYSATTGVTPQYFVLRQNGLDTNGEALYRLQKAEMDGKSLNYQTFGDGLNYMFLNTSSYFYSKFTITASNSPSPAVSPYYNLYRVYPNATDNSSRPYANQVSQCNDAVVNMFSGTSSDLPAQLTAKGSWNGRWQIVEQSYTAWQVVITGAAGGSITYKGTSLLSGATTTQSNNGMFVINSASTPTSSDFTINNVDGCLTDPSISFDTNRKLIKVKYTEYATIYNTIKGFLDGTPEGIGYPTVATRATLQSAIDAFDASSKVTSDLVTLNIAYTAFQNTENVNLPEIGKVYTIQNYVKSPSKTTYLKNVNGTLTIGAEADATALNNLWIVRKSGSNDVTLQSAADQTKYIVYNSFTLNTTGAVWTLSCGTEWPYISMFNGSLADSNGRYVACNGSNQFGTAGGSGYYGRDKTQASGWSTDFKFVESTGYALYKVKIICPQGSSPTVTYNETAYSNGGEFLAATGLTTASLSVSEVTGYTPTIFIDDDIVYVTYDMTLNQTYADQWHFDSNPWALLQEVPASLPTDRTYRYNTKRLHITTNSNSTVAVKFAYFGSGSYRIDVAGVDLINPSTGAVVKADYHDGYSGGKQSNREYVITDVAPGDYILRYISWSQSTSSDGDITIKITPATGFYRIKNNGTGNYLAYGTPYASSLSDSRPIGLIATATANDVASVIKLTGSNGKYKLSAQGLNIQSQTSNDTAFPGSEDTGVDFVFNISSSGVVSITNEASYVNNNYDGSLHEATGDWTVHAVVNWDASADNSKWVIEKAENVTVALHNGGDGKSYATFYAPFDVTFTGATAYTITRGASIEDVGCEAVTTAVENNFVPAGTPVVLINEDTPSPATSCTATIEGTVSDALSTANILSGTYLAMTVEDSEDLVFGKPADGDPGFYRFDPEALSKVLGANKAYIDRTVAAGIRAFVFDSVTTGLNKVNLDAAKENIYDMQGRRVAKVQNGLYIVNGKKVLVK